MSLLVRPYTLTQTDQNTVKSSCKGAGHKFFARHAPRRAKKRCSSAIETCKPISISARRSSSSEMSFRASQIAISAPRSSIRRERISPPCGLGEKSPVSRRCACQRIAVDGATPKRVAVARQLIPSSTAARSRERKSIGRWLAHPSRPPSPARILKQKLRFTGSPFDSERAKDALIDV